MFYKNNAYIIPIIILSGFGGANIAFIQYKNKPKTQTIFWCFMGAIDGVIEGAILGLIWPITIPVLLGRYINK